MWALAILIAYGPRRTFPRLLTFGNVELKSQPKEKTMSGRASLFVLVVLLTVPASAAQFFIVEDNEKKSCTIAQEAPTGDRYTLMGDGAYGDEATAAADMSKILACKPRDATSDAPQSPTGMKKE
jgi:hypothetical protein